MNVIACAITGAAAGFNRTLIGAASRAARGVSGGLAAWRPGQPPGRPYRAAAALAALIAAATPATAADRVKVGMVTTLSGPAAVDGEGAA